MKQQKTSDTVNATHPLHIPDTSFYPCPLFPEFQGNLRAPQSSELQGSP